MGSAQLKLGWSWIRERGLDLLSYPSLGLTSRFSCASFIVVVLSSPCGLFENWVATVVGGLAPSRFLGLIQETTPPPLD